MSTFSTGQPAKRKAEEVKKMEEEDVQTKKCDKRGDDRGGLIANRRLLVCLDSFPLPVWKEAKRKTEGERIVGGKLKVLEQKILS